MKLKCTWNSNVQPDSRRELKCKERFINEILQLPMNVAVISDGSKHCGAACLQHLFTDVKEASLILEKQPLLFLQPLAQRSDLNTVRMTKMVFTHRLYHHAALNVGQFKALLV